MTRMLRKAGYPQELIDRYEDKLLEYFEQKQHAEDAPYGQVIKGNVGTLNIYQGKRKAPHRQRTRLRADTGTAPPLPRSAGTSAPTLRPAHLQHQRLSQCEALNMVEGGVSNSQHQYGEAADLSVPSKRWHATGSSGLCATPSSTSCSSSTAVACATAGSTSPVGGTSPATAISPSLTIVHDETTQRTTAARHPPGVPPLRTEVARQPLRALPYWHLPPHLQALLVDGLWPPPS